MKVNEVTEGYWSTLGQGLARDLVGGAGSVNTQKSNLDKRKQDLQNRQAKLSQVQANLAGQQQANQQFKTNPARDKTTTEPLTVPNPKEGSVMLVKAANGEQYFKSYNGTWHLKGKAPDDYSVGGTQITNPADKLALDKLLPQAQLIGVKPATNEPGDVWVYDKRKTLLLNKHRGNR